MEVIREIKIRAGEVHWAAGGWSEHSLMRRRVVCLMAQHGEENVTIESCCRVTALGTMYIQRRKNIICLVTNLIL